MKSLVIGTAGHIDHGKSALVKALTGTDPDRLKEERVRGITIDLGFAHASIDNVDVAFVDVPGHERFVRNMLAGAGGIDGVLLVVAADESIKPQTREHFEICRLLGIERGVIALTKADLADPDTLGLVELEVRDFVAGSFLESAPIVPVSSRTGAGLDTLRAALARLPSASTRLNRPGLVRLPIDRVFVMKGFGTVVTGTLVSGTMREGTELSLLPEGRKVRVRGVQVHGSHVTEASAPRRVAINLGAVEASELARGMTLATDGAVEVTKRFDAKLRLLDDARSLKHGARVRVHQGTSELAARVMISATRAADSTADWQPAAAGRPAAVAPGGESYVRIRLEHPAALTRGDRTVLRAYSPAATIGGAVVLDPQPPATGLRRAGAVARFEAIDRPSTSATWLDESRVCGLSAPDLVRRGGLEIAESGSVLDELVSSGRGVRAGSRVFSSAVAEEMKVSILEGLAQFHRMHPVEAGMPRETLRDLVATRAPQELFDAVLAMLAGARAIKGVDRIARFEHVETVADDERRGRERIEQILQSAGLTPPDIPQLSVMAGLAESAVKNAVQWLVRERRLVRLDTLVFHSDTLSDLRRQVQSMKSADPVARVDVATFKERYGLSRKYAIPLLEWLDRERITKRVGDTRIVL